MRRVSKWSVPGRRRGNKKIRSLHSNERRNRCGDQTCREAEQPSGAAGHLSASALQQLLTPGALAAGSQAGWAPADPPGAGERWGQMPGG